MYHGTHGVLCRYLGKKGIHVGIPAHRFGASGPTAAVYKEEFNITVESVVAAVKKTMA
jgi:transketolase